MIIACIISFIIGAMLMLCVMGVVSNCKGGEPRNKVRFYVTRDIDKVLWLWIGKPKRSYYDGAWERDNNSNNIAGSKTFYKYNLNPSDYDSLKWEDEPIEVFLNLED